MVSPKLRRLASYTGIGPAGMHLEAILYRDAQFNEYRVRFYTDHRLNHSADYHTDHRSDAEEAAKRFVGQFKDK